MSLSSQSIIQTTELNAMIDGLYKCNLLKENAIRQLCAAAISIFATEGNLHCIKAPLTICGDTHGQFYDLMELFRLCGKPPQTNYLFLGDYINRGNFSVESLSLLLALKVRYPKRITLLRGGSDCRKVSEAFGFYDEVKAKYGSSKIWKIFCDTLDHLPLAALLNKQIFCVHSGLSPQINTLQHIMEYHRFWETPREGPMFDLLWSNPSEGCGWGSSRGSYTFGKDLSTQFMHTNGLSLISRAHQLVQDGYHWTHDKNVVTIFSAPNFVYRCGNKAAVMKIDDSLECMFVTFDAVKDRPKLSEKVTFIEQTTEGREASESGFVFVEMPTTDNANNEKQNECDTGSDVCSEDDNDEKEMLNENNNKIICWGDRMSKMRPLVKWIIFEWIGKLEKKIPMGVYILITQFSEFDAQYIEW